MRRLCNCAGGARPSALGERKATSISQNDRPDALPDFRNLGAVARVLLFVNAAAALAALLRAQSVSDLGPQFLELALWVEPTLFAVLAVLYAGSSLLGRMQYGLGFASVLLLVVMTTAILSFIQTNLGRAESQADIMTGIVTAAALAAMLLEYFRLRSRAFSPALAEARLQALQARIRPHFLFNSLNAVLAIIRSDPRRAEGALEDLADLFRSVIADNRQLVPLGDEVELCRRYLNLEHLRLGDRLEVTWDIDAGADMALVPPMLLQPLVENAVYHGIEPGIGRAVVRIRIAREGDRLRIALSNPYHPEHQHRQGNRMALANIRERLLLHFDVEARLDAAVAGDRYQIDMVLPFRRSA